MTTNTSEPTLIVIVGPTGSGKTDLSISLAQRFDAPVISTDSRQVYRGMAIGTAQPSIEQLQNVKHYFIADRDITQTFTCGQFEKEALELLETLFSKHKYVIAAGGSGLYIDALCNGLDRLPHADLVVRLQLQEQLDKYGLEQLAEQLKGIDPAYYNKVDLRNPARVMRALEVCLTSGLPYSALRSGQKAKRNFKIIKIGIRTERHLLYESINSRVDEMMRLGLENEARKLYPQRELNALNTLGYKELFDYFDGQTTLDEAVELIKRNSRRYAKRQMTWFNRDVEVQWFDKKDINSIENFIKKFAE